MILKKWSDKLKTNRDMFSSILIWVRYPYIHSSLINPNGLNVISSILGILFEADLSTTMIKRINYTRCIIEIKPDSTFPKEVPVALFNGGVFYQPVIYE